MRSSVTANEWLAKFSDLGNRLSCPTKPLSEAQEAAKDPNSVYDLSALSEVDSYDAHICDDSEYSEHEKLEVPCNGDQYHQKGFIWS